MATDPTPATPATGGILAPDSASNVLVDPAEVAGLVAPTTAPEPADGTALVWPDTSATYTAGWYRHDEAAARARRETSIADADAHWFEIGPTSTEADPVTWDEAQARIHLDGLEMAPVVVMVPAARLDGVKNELAELNEWAGWQAKARDGWEDRARRAERERDGIKQCNDNQADLITRIAAERDDALAKCTKADREMAEARIAQTEAEEVGTELRTRLVAVQRERDEARQLDRGRRQALAGTTAALLAQTKRLTELARQWREAGECGWPEILEAINGTAQPAQETPAAPDADTDTTEAGSEAQGTAEPALALGAERALDAAHEAASNLDDSYASGDIRRGVDAGRLLLAEVRRLHAVPTGEPSAVELAAREHLAALDREGCHGGIELLLREDLRAVLGESASWQRHYHNLSILAEGRRKEMFQARDETDQLRRDLAALEAATVKIDADQLDTLNDDAPTLAAAVRGAHRQPAPGLAAQQARELLADRYVCLPANVLDLLRAMLTELDGEYALRQRSDRARHSLAQGWAERGMEIQRLQRELDEARRARGRARRSWHEAENELAEARQAFTELKPAAAPIRVTLDADTMQVTVDAGADDGLAARILAALTRLTAALQAPLCDSVAPPVFTNAPSLTACELPYGHPGAHAAGLTRWGVTELAAPAGLDIDEIMRQVEAYGLQMADTCEPAGATGVSARVMVAHTTAAKERAQQTLAEIRRLLEAGTPQQPGWLITVWRQRRRAMHTAYPARWRRA